MIGIECIRNNNKHDINIDNGNDRSEINTNIGKLIMHLNTGINEININPLNSIQINTNVLALIINNVNVSIPIITQMKSGDTNSPTIQNDEKYIYDDPQDDRNYVTDETGHGINELMQSKLLITFIFTGDGNHKQCMQRNLNVSICKATSNTIGGNFMNFDCDFSNNYLIADSNTIGGTIFFYQYRLNSANISNTY